ncbi:hypothetical protein I3U52_05065 [Mycobacteroides abscessus subsp. abscessus]|jgi:hypothetical protein|nr:hypothetical protein [Mycobacteroides abscessus subsp. abscessus]MBN7414370.1 hypothetical protein [Mycobacteroides abscessus subsp. abscessus]
MMNRTQHEAIQAAYARAAERRVAIDADFLCIEALNWVDRPTAHEEFITAMDANRRMREESNAQLQFELEVAEGKWDNFRVKRP